MHLMLFAPELVLIAGCLAVFGLSLAEGRGRPAAQVTLPTAFLSLGLCAATLNAQAADLFFRAYRVDLFSQLFKLFIHTAIGIYYYLNIVRVMCFSDAGERPAVRLDAPTAVLGALLLLPTVYLGVDPARLLDGALSALHAAARSNI